MLIRKPADIQPSEITPESVYRDRRAVVASLLGAGAALAFPGREVRAAAPAPNLKYTANKQYQVADTTNSWEEVTGYNNYYELGTDKSDPARNAGTLKPRPWTVEITGECDLKGRLNIEDILKAHPLEERVYRFRCVEAWSMVIPWTGFPMKDFLTACKPNSRAKYVEFTTLRDPRQLPGQLENVLPWPYVEGLRIDEAMHPLAFMVVGVFGRELPGQNGAPLRTMAPWKYGFKNGKSIVKVNFTEKQPANTWAVSNPHEYGFYANVNPAVDHPRWSQATERRIGGGLFAKRVNTLPFNGYAEQVASLYAGMDLRRNF
jgi:sulfoxide reductase catalytic subunit YedY